MGTIQSSVGLISGIDTGTLITQLLSLQSKPVTDLQTQIANGTAAQSALSGLATQLGSLKSIGDSLTLPTTFKAATATSSDPNVLTATASNGAALGAYSLQVAQLVTSQQSVTQGFADSSTPVGAGTLTIDLGGGSLQTQTQLANLNGGKGVNEGLFRITDASGKSDTIDTTGALTLDDIAKRINSANDINVKASIGPKGLVIEDLTGSTTGKLTITNLGNDTAASDLGIAGTATGNTLTGINVNTIGNATQLSSLNGGKGVFSANAGADFRVLAANGTSFDVDVSTAKTVGDVITLINKASNGSVIASVSTSGNNIQLADQTGGSGPVVVASLNQSTAAGDLGILGSSNSSTLQGQALVGGADSTLISSLNGGKGLSLGPITITDRSGNSQTIDLTGSTSVSDILDKINNQVDPTTGKHNISVQASISGAGNGIALTDTSGGTGNLVVADGGTGTTAEQLGLAGSYANTIATVNGANLHAQYITANTLLKDYNGGKGVALGKIQITNSSGKVAVVDLSAINATKIGDVLAAINKTNIGVSAQINAEGNGISLTDYGSGSAKLAVADLGSTTASDLNLVGTATGNTLDGALEKTIAVTSTDTLDTVATKINQLGFGVTASVINDGSSSSPSRLSLNATGTGLAGAFTFDAGTTGLATTNLVNAQNAAVYIGGTNGTKPLLVTSSSNSITNVIKGVTINLLNTSTAPVTLSVTADSSAIATQLNNFVTGYNAITSQLSTLTSYNTTTNTGGVLLGDAGALSIEEDLATIVNGVVKGAGKYQTLSQLGITVGANNQLSFDQTKFDAAFAADPSSLAKLFTQTTTGFGTLISKTINQLTDPVSGVITVENNTITERNQGYQDRITQLNTLLDAQKTRLQLQFANMESILAGLQSQQSALSSLTGTTATTSSASTTASRATSTSSSSSS